MSLGNLIELKSLAPRAVAMAEHIKVTLEHHLGRRYHAIKHGGGADQHQLHMANSTCATATPNCFICFWFQRVEKNLHRSALTFGPGERTSNCSEFVTFSEDKKRGRLCALNLNSNQPNSPRTPPLPSRRVLYERQSAGTEYVSSKQINSDSSCAIRRARSAYLA
jgi:hypothetical protein